MALSRPMRNAVLARDNFTCVRCGFTSSAEQCIGRETDLHVHHKVAKLHGGRDTIPNLETLCKPCHHRHHADDPPRPKPNTLPFIRNEQGQPVDQLGRVYGPDDHLSAKQAANLMGKSLRETQRLCKEGLLPALNVGGRFVVKARDALAYEARPAHRPKAE